MLKSTGQKGKSERMGAGGQNLKEAGRPVTFWMDPVLGVMRLQIAASLCLDLLYEQPWLQGQFAAWL